MVRIHAGQPFSQGPSKKLLYMDTSSTPPSLNPAGASPRGSAIASLVLGISALVLSPILVGGLLGLIGVITSIVFLRRKSGAQGMARWGLVLSLAGIVATVGFGSLYYQGFKFVKKTVESVSETANAGEWEGVMAPDFTVTTLDGQKITLSELKGRRVVLDFWATWCAPCVMEIPHFIDLAKQNSTNELVIVGISSEMERELRPFVKSKEMNYPIASAQDLPPPYGEVSGIPTTFFIDRNGVIQNILVGYHDPETLKRHALQEDFKGNAKKVPSEGSELKQSSEPLQATPAWTTNIAGAAALCAGDWDGDNVPEILLADRNSRLHVLDLNGTKKNTINLPETFSVIECGKDKERGVQLLGYTMWQKEVVVMSRNGKKIWSYGGFFGVDGAHFGDLDGDGSDELIVGMNGMSGLHAVGRDGQLFWKEGALANVWSQAVVPARNGKPGLVFATEAGGSVRVFDAKGNQLRSIRPKKKYCTQLDAAIMDQTGTIQGIVNGDGTIMAFDPSGSIAWFAAGIKNSGGGWQNVAFAAGDVNGDGVQEWAFLDASGNLTIATIAGEILVSIPQQQSVNSFAIASQPKNKGLLVTLTGPIVQAYKFKKP